MPRIKITLSEMTEILCMPDTKEEIYKAWEHIVTHGFIFNYFTLITEDTETFHRVLGPGRLYKHVYKVTVNGTGDEQNFDIKILVTRPDGTVKTTKKNVTAVDFLGKLSNTVLEFENVKDINKWNVDRDEIHVMLPMMFMQYAVLKSMNREVIEMPTTQKRYKPMSERKPSKPKEEYKLFDVIRKYSKHINHNKHHITCEAWEVKGHFRHYKSGKVVYVKPFQKGKGKVKDKEYKL